MQILLLSLLGLGMASLILGSADDSDGDGSTDQGSSDLPEDGRFLDIKVSGGHDLVDLGVGNTPARVSGSAGHDTILSGGGEDTIYGGRGNDSVTTGDGDDRVTLADGSDYWGDLIAGNGPSMTGDDFVRGGEGDDTLISHGGADTIFGDTGDDVLDGRESAQASNGRGLFEDSLTAGSGDDLIYADDGDRVSAGKGADTIHADLTVGAASGVAWDAARDWAPIQLSDFDPAEDLLIIDLPDHEPLGLQDMRYTGTNGDEITLVLGGYQLATLSGVRFEDLGSTNFALR